MVLNAAPLTVDDVENLLEVARAAQPEEVKAINKEVFAEIEGGDMVKDVEDDDVNRQIIVRFVDNITITQSYRNPAEFSITPDDAPIYAVAHVLEKYTAALLNVGF